MSQHLIDIFLNDLEAVKKTAIEAAMNVSSDFSDDDLDHIIDDAYLKACENQANYKGKPQPHEWFLKIAQNTARDLLKNGRKSKVKKSRVKMPKSPLDDDYRRKKLESVSVDDAYKSAIKYIGESGLFLEEERLISIAEGFTGKVSTLVERELIQIIETTCHLYSAYLKASGGKKSGKEGAKEKKQQLDQLRVFNERNHGIPEIFLRAMTGDWEAVKLMVTLYPRWLLSGYDDDVYYKIIREHVLFRLLGIITKTDHRGRTLDNEELKRQRHIFEELYNSQFTDRISSAALQFIVTSFQRIYKSTNEIPFDMKDETILPESLEELMIEISRSKRISLKTTKERDSQRIVTEEMWSTYAKNHTAKYGGNHTADSMANYMTSKATGLSIDIIRKRIKSIDGSDS